jgi:hypothetical protein
MGEPTVFAKVSFRFRGFHKWDDAPAEVKHLKDRHRHVFHVTAKIQQSHDDRDVEYIMLKRDLRDYMTNTFSTGEPIEFGTLSCEMIAKKLIAYMQREYPGRPRYFVEVLEDGENGATVSALENDDIGPNYE